MSFVFQLLLFIILIVFIAKAKNTVAKLWGSINSDTKLVVKEQPSKYRNYNKYVLVSEVTHWEVSPILGVAKDIISRNFISEFKGGFASNLSDELTVEEILELWEDGDVETSNRELYSALLRELADRLPRKQKYNVDLFLIYVKNAI